MKHDLHTGSHELETEYWFRKLEHLKKVDRARFFSIINASAIHFSAATDLFPAIKFGWNTDYSIGVYYRGISRSMIFSESDTQFALHFIGDDEPTSPIICLKTPKIFIHSLLLLEAEGIIPQQDLSPVIVARCKMENGNPLQERTIQTYIADCRKSHPSKFLSDLIARVMRKRIE